MHFILITNYKKKLLLFFSILLLWILLIEGSGILIDKTVTYTITLNSKLSFSYTSALSISDIYAKYNDSAPYLQASNSNYKNFIDYKSPEEGIKFSYPSIFEINTQSFPGSEILYHIDFQNKQDKMKRGFIQVWNLPYSLDTFLENSKKTSLENFMNFTQQKIKENNLSGYLWEYVIKGNTENYKGLEVFLSKNSKLYRISYFVPENKYNKDEYDMFLKIVKSLKVS
jgi:hypothetical protein